MQRLMDVASTARERKDDLLEAARTSPPLGPQLVDDLQRLREEIEGISNVLSREIRRLGFLADEVGAVTRGT